MLNSEGSNPFSTSSLLRLKSNNPKPSVSSSHTSREEESGFISDEEDKVYTDGLVTWATKKGFIEELVESKTKQKKSTKTTHRSETIIQQELIDKLAKEEIIKYPKHTKTTLATDLADRPEISIKEETIRRDYLDKFPDF